MRDVPGEILLAIIVNLVPNRAGAYFMLEMNGTSKIKTSQFNPSVRRNFQSDLFI
jgi:hypothetical protein